MVWAGNSVRTSRRCRRRSDTDSRYVPPPLSFGEIPMEFEDLPELRLDHILKMVVPKLGMLAPRQTGKGRFGRRPFGSSDRIFMHATLISTDICLFVQIIDITATWVLSSLTLVQFPHNAESPLDTHGALGCRPVPVTSPSPNSQ